MNEVPTLSAVEIQNLIYSVRGMQVMFDNDLAQLYNVEIRRLNEQVKRNQARFPAHFMFQITKDEFNDLIADNPKARKGSLRSQFATLKTSDKTGKGTGKHRKYLPYAFTEQGVAMLSAVLRSETAVKVSIQIMDAFVQMRKFLLENGQILSRIGTIEKKQIETDHKIDQIFTALEERDITPKKGLFFEGQVYDAYVLVARIIRSAKKSLVLIDNYIDDSVLTLFTKRKKGVRATIHTRTISKQLKLDIEKHNQQYPLVTIKEIKNVHDRFLIVDNETVYHVGASLKDLGKKWFAFSKMGKEGMKIVERLG